MGSLPEWSDPDRRDAALERVAARLMRPEPLSRMEAACLYLASYGRNEADTAVTLCVSENTVKRHLEHARIKLLARNTTHAVAIAFRAKLIP